MKYKYKGSVFEVDFPYRTSDCYKIYNIVEHGECVIFPDMIDGIVVSDFAHRENGWGYHRNEEYILHGVTKLVIPATIERLSLYNYMFPDIEILEVDDNNRKYSTDGKMLYSKDGKSLVLALCAGMTQEKVIVPEEVDELEQYSFTDTICKTIEFENKNIKLKGNPFDFSTWFTEHVDNNTPVYVGNMLFRASKGDELKVKPFVTRFDSKAFIFGVPDRLETPTIPYRISEFSGNFGKSPKTLVITSNIKVNLRMLGEWKRLEAVEFENSKHYKSIDGVVFSRDGKTLLRYPSCKEDKEYSVPNGVKRIEKGAFSDQGYLERVFISDTVMQIGQGAFYGCHALRSVNMSGGLTEISDASVFQPHGVFEKCEKLTEVLLPPKLLHIGAKAFCGCKKLDDIVIPEEVKSIGEYAFYDTMIQSYRLPKSLLHVMDGALMSGEFNKPLEVTAYEGSARGIVSAIEGVRIDDAKKAANLLWRPAVIHMVKGNGALADSFMIPTSLKHSSGAYIDSAWNRSKFSYDDYHMIFNDIQDSGEKIDFATKMVSKKIEAEDSEYEQYLRHASSRIALGMIDKKDEEGLISFIKRGYVSENLMTKLLGKCNKAELTTASAYILQFINKNKKKKKGASVIRL